MIPHRRLMEASQVAKICPVIGPISQSILFEYRDQLAHRALPLWQGLFRFGPDSRAASGANGALVYTNTEAGSANAQNRA